MKQIVKNYANYQGDFRSNVKPVDIVTQINYDLKKNPSWSIKLLTYLNDDTVCTVIYDIDESSRVLVESKKEMPFVNIEQVSTTNTEDAKDSTPTTVTEVLS
jgi:hypothetical protein